MKTTDVVIVGGGPAGSSCAWRLRQQGIACVVLDKKSFPRTKLCGGWLSPQVLQLLDFGPADYPGRFNTFESMHAHLGKLRLKIPTIQHSIRRWEFDQWLLERGGAEVEVHEVREIAPEGAGFVVDDRWSCQYIVGAGGTSCPVYRTLFRDRLPRQRVLQAVTLELEFAFDYADPNCHLWFLPGGLPGYTWYVPKADGYLNVGVGGMKAQLAGRRDSIHDYWRRHTQMLAETLGVTGLDLLPKGYSYYLRNGAAPAQRGNAFLAGDALGLASRDLCEGIAPAIETGLLVAECISSGVDYDAAQVARLSSPRWPSRMLEYLFVTRSERRGSRGRT